MTEIGTTGPAPVHVVGAGGSLAPLGRAQPEIDWWVGAEDRWHTASTEPAVRQGLAEDEVTVETRMRVPGGDMEHRVSAVPDRGGAVALVEIDNATPVPVAVAIVVAADGPVTVFDDAVAIGHGVHLRASRSVARLLVADDRASLLAGLEAGRALPPSEADLPWSGRWTALVFPLPHTARLRVAIAPDGPAPASPNDLPPLDAVARGWAAHLGNGADFSVPDERMGRVVAAARRHLLVGSAQSIDSPFWTDGVEPWVPAVAAAALDRWGHHVEARELLLAAVGPDDLMAHAGRGMAEAGAVLWALADRFERRPDPRLEEALVPWIEQAAIGLMNKPRRRLRRRETPAEPWRAVGLAAAGSLLSRAGNETLGPDIVDALPELIAGAPPALTSPAGALGAHRLGLDDAATVIVVLCDMLGIDDPGLVALAAHADQNAALGWAGRTQHPTLSALTLLAVRQALVDEPNGAGGVLALLREVEPAWLGAPMECHRFAVTGGDISFGVRWHGDRPALLWDVVGADEAWLTAPSLDGAWRSDEARGEALLAPTPALATEAAPESPHVRRGEVIDPDGGPDSFG